MFQHQAASLWAEKEVWLHPQLRLQSPISPGTLQGSLEAGILYSLGFAPPPPALQGLPSTMSGLTGGPGLTRTHPSPHHTLTRVVQQQLWAPGQA